MRIVIPVSVSDADLLQPFIQALDHFKCLENHFVTIVPTPSAIHMAEEIARTIKPFCPQLDIQPMPYDPIGGYFKAPNTIFAHAANRLNQLQNTMPWFWMELDCIPVQKFWADKLANEYARINRPFVGWVNPLKQKIDNVWRDIKGDSMMMGCAIYPADMLRRDRIYTLWKDLGMVVSSTPDPFDRYLRHAMTAENGGSLAHTDLIGDRWRTKNYAVNFVCQNANTEEFGWDHSQSDVSRSVVIHGVRDGSLTRLVLEGSPMVTQPAPVAPEPAIPAATAQFVTHKDLEGFKDELLGSIRQMLQPAAPAPAPEATMPPANLTEHVVRLLSAGKKLRLHDVSGKTGASPEKIRELANAPDCPFQINGPLGWMGLKAVTV